MNGPRRHLPSSAAWTRGISPATPLGAGYYGSAHFALGGCIDSYEGIDAVAPCTSDWQCVHRGPRLVVPSHEAPIGPRPRAYLAHHAVVQALQRPRKLHGGRLALLGSSP